MEVRRRYGTEVEFLTTFSPDRQAEYAEKGLRCFSGMAPSLRHLRVVYGQAMAESWVEIQLRDLSEFAGCREKLDSKHTEQLAKTIILHFGYLKVTEMMVFFQLFKSGEYGHFYGAVDGLMITEALREFLTYRADQYRRIEKKQQEQAEWECDDKREAMKRKGLLMGFDEWKEISWLFNM